MFVLNFCIHFGHFNPGNQEILSLTFLMMPSLLFICLFGLNASLLQCEKSFFIPSVAPVAFNLMWIFGVFVTWTYQPALPMKWLSIAVIAACFAQWIMTMPKTWQFIRSQLKADFWQGMCLYPKSLRGLMIPLFCGIAGVAASQVNNALDALFARYANSEGPAFLWFSIRLQQLPLALFGIAISGALLPPLSRAIKNGELPTYQHFLEFALRRSVSLMLPITFGFFVLGDACINLIYGHGDFHYGSIIKTTQCLWAYTLGLIPMALVLIFAPAFYALGNYRVPTIASVLAVILNVGLNTLLVMVCGYGTCSVAIATSCSAWFNLIFLCIALNRNLGFFNLREFSINFSKTLLASLLAALAVICSRSYFSVDHSLWQILSNQPAVFPQHIFDQFSFMILHSLVFGVVFCSVAWLTKAEDLLSFFIFRVFNVFRCP
jgi:putative peptidoglycan lipid II flippase